MKNILLIGAGGRESTFAWKLSQSPELNQLYITPGNAGTSAYGTNLNFKETDFDSIGNFVLQNGIHMVIVGPEAPLVAGISDYFASHPQLKYIPVIGPGKQGAMLEGSKDFSKQFMIKHGIPTAAYGTFTSDTLAEGIDFLKKLKAPYVLKADGLAGGKGVLICDELVQARLELSSMLIEEKFGEASSKVVIEEFLHGIELSVFVITDGENYKILPAAKDYKRIGEGDTGLNTGGMGAVSPVVFADDEFMQKVEERIVKPTINGLKKDKIPYTGFIFIGLMNVGGEPQVIEYNCRMGDPETEVVLPRIKTDLVQIMEAMGNGTLDEIDMDIDPRFATTVMLVADGYPGKYEKGKVIKNLDKVTESLVFHAGTKKDDKGQVLTNGGRIIALTSYGETMQEALGKSFRSADTLDFSGKYYRRDIGFDLQAKVLEK